MSRIPVSRKDRVRSEAKKRRVADQNISSQSLSATDVNAIIAQYLIDNPVGGSSVGKIVAFDSDVITSGASGAVLTRTAVAGQYFKVTTLSTNSTSQEPTMTLTVNGVDIFTSGALIDATPLAAATSTSFGVFSNYGTNSLETSARVLPEINCTSFTLTKDSGTTGQPILYAYQTLEAL